MKTRLLIIIALALVPFVFLNVDASCDKQVGHADESCTPDELLEICHTLWSPRYDGSATLGNIFCRAVYDLDLNENDVRKLGIHLDWENYAMESAKEFVDDWGFYQDHAIPNTLQIHPSISMSDSLPPIMKVQISFDWIDGSEIKIFDESLRIYMKYTPEIIPLPENTWVIMPPRESSLSTNQLDERCRNGQALCQPPVAHDPYVTMSGNNLEVIILTLLVGGISVSFILGIIYWWKRK
ncbi:MAG: hypothetical protein K5790_01740 [Nitrosopumilus sp.]|uniref:hypothetical protein n=1 Tax=Nitrosopumilus sp. TaxID=2024843 RepID=UPI00247D70D3|nr:hypothetical protein [Nitrosopumilus sp.]MCV0391996.1 hypothetical protein [Nitrosopumilus sp.]